MKKLMIGEIQTRFNLFNNNTLTIKPTLWIERIREEFQNYFGSADDYLKERIIDHKKKHNGKSYWEQEIRCRYFKLKNYKAASINYQQISEEPKGRGLYVRLVNWDNFEEKSHIVPFIKFYCNPEGIYILEKIWFDTIV